jgi:hypothetical protein
MSPPTIFTLFFGAAVKIFSLICFPVYYRTIFIFQTAIGLLWYKRMWRPFELFCDIAIVIVLLEFFLAKIGKRLEFYAYR